MVCGEDIVGWSVFTALVDECTVATKARKRYVRIYLLSGPLIVKRRWAAEVCVFFLQIQQPRVRRLEVLFSTRRERNARRCKESFVNSQLAQERHRLSLQFP